MNVLSILKESRTERTLPSIMLIILAIAMENRINTEIILLAISMILIYFTAGIHNSIKDKDILPKNKEKLILLLPIILATIISLQNKLLFYAIILWVILGISYNTFSRKTLLLDTTIMAITHYLMPITFSLLLLGKDLNYSLEIGTIFFSLFWFILPMKNMKGKIEDKKLGYKTLSTTFKNGDELSMISSVFFIILLTIIQIQLGVSYIFIIITILIYLTGIIFMKKNTKLLMNFFRLLFIFSIFSLISTTQNSKIIIISSIISTFYLINILTKK